MSALVVAAFDFDGTLTDGGSVWRYVAAMVGRRKVALAGLVILPRLAYAAVVGGPAIDAAKEALFVRTLAGLDAHELEERSAAFGVAHYHRHARADVRARLEWHRARGDRVVVVSASPESYVASAAAELGVDAVIATRLAVDPTGRITGRYDGRNCRGDQKVERLRRWIADQAATDWSSAYVWAYGNSAGDRRLLAAADIGVNVGRLGRFGRLRAFTRLSEVVRDGRQPR
ncbi:MAG TPA: HAD-IB family hydrolase [Acidimicrobiales bacterium]|nr:HAD-IB family hydrolase [Acidimicrobiales bacterium]